MGSLISAALARAGSFLLEPAAEDVPAPPAAVTPLPTAAPIQVAVIGLGAASGVSTVATGLAHCLVVPGLRSAHLISLRGGDGSGRAGAGAVSRWELPPALRAPAEVAEYGETLTRFAAGEGAAAVVWDVPAGEAQRASEAAARCGTVVCVADGSAEPALCLTVCAMLAERYGRVLLAANRVREADRWAGRCAVAIPESRLGAWLIARGRSPSGVLATTLGRLGELVEET